MEGFLFVLIMVWVFSRMSRKAKKGPTSRNAADRRRRETFQRMMRMASQPAPAPEPQPVPFAPLQGSLDYASTEGQPSDEGEDICDPALGHERVTPVEPDSVYAQEIGGGLPPITPQSLVQGVVMSEILNRPAYHR